MGCDIHIHVEYKRHKFIGSDGDNKPQYVKEWACGDYFKINPYYPDDPDDEKLYSLVEFCDDRNYERFSILANVRNYGGTDYISEPRGLPTDVTKEVKEDADNWGYDGHSHSYMTLKELIDFQKDIKPLKRRGMISPEAQKALDERGMPPEFWCYWTNTEGWDWREWEDENTVLLPLIEALKQRASELYVIHSFLWKNNPKEAYWENSREVVDVPILTKSDTIYLSLLYDSPIS